MDSLIFGKNYVLKGLILTAQMDLLDFSKSMLRRCERDYTALDDTLALLKEIERMGGMVRDSHGIEHPCVTSDYFKAAHNMSNKLLQCAASGIVNGGGGHALETYNNTLLFDAPYNFDKFMLYTERNRPVEKQFWLPRRKKIMFICQALQDMEDGKLDELFLSMPGRTGKSTIVMFFTVWVMLRDSERSNLYCSYTDKVVGTFYDGVLEILNDNVTYDWHNVFPRSSVVSTNAKDFLINIDRKKRYASLTARSLYATLNGACDCDGYEIADDILSGIEEAVNPDRLASAWNRVDNNYLPRGKENSKRLWIGTRWATQDPQGIRLAMIENDANFRHIRWKAINVPALDDNDESNFDYDYGVGFSTEKFKERRASFEWNNDMASWLAQYQGVPVDRSGAVFDPSNMRFYNGELPDGNPDRVFMAVDPAWGGGDYVASPIVYQFGSDLYVADVVYDNRDKTYTQPLLARKAIQHSVSAMRIESTKMTAEYADGVDELLRKQGRRINVEKNHKNWTGTGKEQRIFDKAPEIRERMIFLESGKRSKEYELFMNNVFSFVVEGKNKHDDAPDSLAMAIDMAFIQHKKSSVFKRPF